MNRAEVLAEFFRAKPNTWIDGRDLSEVGGCYAWRTRVSQCRQWFAMTIENRQRRVARADGSHFVVSEYRFVSADTVTPTTFVSQEMATVNNQYVDRVERKPDAMPETREIVSGGLRF